MLDDASTSQLPSSLLGGGKALPFDEAHDGVAMRGDEELPSEEGRGGDMAGVGELGAREEEVGGEGEEEEGHEDGPEVVETEEEAAEGEARIRGSKAP